MKKERKRVIVVNQYAGKPDSGWGERHFLLFQHLSNQMDVTIISSHKNHMQINHPNQKRIFSNLEFVKNIGFGFIKTSEYNPKTVSRFLPLFQFALLIFFIPKKKWKIKNVDTIILSSMSLFPIIGCLYLKRKLKAKQLIFEVRDFWPLTPIELMGISKYNPLILLMTFLEGLAFRYSDKIISLPPKGEEYIIGINKNFKKKIYHLPNGIEPQLFKQEKKINFNPREIKIIYAGTIGFANALEEYIRFIEQDNELTRLFKFEFLGDGYLKKTYEKRIGKFNNVNFIGRVEKNKVSEYLNECDFGIICWHDSALYDLGVSANKYFDYLESGIPIISLNHGRPDLVTEHNCGFNQDNNLESLNFIMKEISNMRIEDYISLCKNAKNASSQYHFSNLSTKLKAIIEVKI